MLLVLTVIASEAPDSTALAPGFNARLTVLPPVMLIVEPTLAFTVVLAVIASAAGTNGAATNPATAKTLAPSAMVDFVRTFIC